MRPTSGSTVFDRVILAVAQTVYVEGKVLTQATRIADDLGMGRLSRLRLALYLEEMFDVELADEAVERFDTIGDIIRHMSRWSHETADVLARTAASQWPWVGA